MTELRVGPGWVLQGTEACLAVDPADGFAAAWLAWAMAPDRLDAVLVTAPRRAEGLFALLLRLAGRARPLSVYFGAWDEVTPGLVAAWLGAGDRDFEVRLETGLPGQVAERLGAVRFESFPAEADQGWLVQSTEGAWAFGATAEQAQALRRGGVRVLS